MVTSPRAAYARIWACSLASHSCSSSPATAGSPSAWCASQYENLPWYEALILSVSSFHGRGFFQPLQTLGDPVAIIASVEAVFGLFIEVAFIATFTQRFFGK